MKIATWNVNSVRARLAHLQTWLSGAAPDVLLLQETKVEDGLFPVEAFRELGYHVLLHGQKTYNGVAAATRIPPEEVSKGLSSGFLSDQARVLRLRLRGITFINVYVPNGGETGTSRFADKLLFLEHLADDAAEAASQGGVVLAGDMNVAPGPDDVHDPEGLDGTVCYHPEERRRFSALLDAGFEDLFRKFNPGGKAYSWWDYRMAGFRRNAGMRLDHVLVTPGLAAGALSCEIDREPRRLEKPSDHAPVVAVLAPAE